MENPFWSWPTPSARGERANFVTHLADKSNDEAEARTAKTFGRGAFAKRWRGFVGAAVLLVALNAVTPAQARDAWLQPFHEDSIWNMPLGRGASYVHARVSAPNFVGFDEEFFERPAPTDPLRDLFHVGSWDNRDTGTQFLEKFRVRDNFTLQDLDGGGEGNHCAVFRETDGHTIRQLNAATRPQIGGTKIWGYRSYIQNLYKHGHYGNHGGSALSGIGGSIRKGELTGAAPIRHALKLCVSHDFLSGVNGGWRWPAIKADDIAPGGYLGSVPAMRMGSLLAIPDSVTDADLNLETPQARKILAALRDYGAYVVDDSNWDAVYWEAESTVVGELNAALGYNSEGSQDTAWRRDTRKLIVNLHVVDNNVFGQTGGPGARPSSTLLGRCPRLPERFRASAGRCRATI